MVALYFGLMFVFDGTTAGALGVAPLAVSVCGYTLFRGRPLWRRTLVTLTPLIALPLLILFMEWRDALVVVALHSFLIGMLLVGLWECILWILGSDRPFKSDAHDDGVRK